MADDELASLLAALDVDPACRDSPTEGVILSVSCLFADCEHDPAWLAGGSAAHIGVTTLGNRTWERRGDERALQDSIREVVADRTVDGIVVVGHTDCDVLADAYDRAFGTTASGPAGIQASLAPLETVVDEAIASDVVDSDSQRRRVRQRLVEYNVVCNVAFLRSCLPSTPVAGVVTDQAGVYGSFPGKQYLVVLDEATEPATLRAQLPEDAQLAVGRLLSTAAIRDITGGGSRAR
jgi:hypothetical protein